MEGEACFVEQKILFAALICEYNVQCTYVYVRDYIFKYLYVRDMDDNRAVQTPKKRKFETNEQEIKLYYKKEQGN